MTRERATLTDTQLLRFLSDFAGDCDVDGMHDSADWLRQAESRIRALTILPPEPVAKGGEARRFGVRIQSGAVSVDEQDGGPFVQAADYDSLRALYLAERERAADLHANGERLKEAADGWKAEADALRDVERALANANARIASLEAELGVEWPEEPTEEMLEAGYQAACGHDWPKNWSDGGMTPELYTAKVVYKAMRAAHLAAPQKP